MTLTLNQIVIGLLPVKGTTMLSFSFYERRSFSTVRLLLLWAALSFLSESATGLSPCLPVDHKVLDISNSLSPHWIILFNLNPVRISQRIFMNTCSGQGHLHMKCRLLTWRYIYSLDPMYYITVTCLLLNHGNELYTVFFVIPWPHSSRLRPEE